MPRQTVMRVVVLISGRGSNLDSLIRARSDSPFDIVGVISNNPNAAGLQIAADAGIDQCVVDHRDFPDREAFDRELANQVEAFQPDLVVLAGFMRILTDAFVTEFEGRMINIHPSLLPRYPGLDTHQRALDAGDTEHGASIHFVTPVLDGGPVIAQTRIAIGSDDTAEELARRLLPLEHRLMTWTVDLLARGVVQFRHGQIRHHDAPLRTPLRPD